MLRKLLICLALLLPLALSGCIDSTTLVFVKKDGSGYVMETVYMSLAIKQTLQEITTDQEQNILLPTEMAQYSAKAQMMGTGVKLASAKKVLRNDGFSGVQVIYSFDDINQLKLSPEPDNSSSTPEMSPPTGDTRQKIPITFEFVNTRGPKSKLIINMPPIPENKTSETTPDIRSKPMTMPPIQLEMMKQIFKGMRIRIIVKVDGKILTSNAAYIGKGKKSNVKQFVTLFEMDVNKLADNNAFMKITSLSQSTDLASAANELQNIPGVKLETADRVEIEFR